MSWMADVFDVMTDVRDVSQVYDVHNENDCLENGDFNGKILTCSSLISFNARFCKAFTF